MIKLVVIFVSCVLLFACKPKATQPEVMAGDAEFSKFVSIGDGHMAGYMDDALYRDAQLNSLGAILQNQLMLVGANSTWQPLMGPSNLGVNLNNLSKLILGYKTDCAGNTALSPVRFSNQNETAGFSTSSYNSAQKFTNFAVPGLRMIDLTSNALGNPNGSAYNPYFGRLSKDQLTLPGTGTWSSFQANLLDGGYPTFCAIYLGIEDFLPFVKSGASQFPMSPIAGAPGIGFEESLVQLCEQLKDQEVQAVLATLPDVTDWPYFTTIPYNGLNLDEDKAINLNQIYGPLGYSFQVGPNPFMIEDPNAGMFGVRPMVAGELLLLSVPLDSVKCNQMGSIYPLRNEFVLTLDELSAIRAQILLYNQCIRSAAQTYGFGVVETPNFYSNLKTGFAYIGVSLSAKFVSGGAFSLDGIHLNPRGNALLANEFIKVIKSKYKTKIPLIQALQYNAVLFP